MSSNQPNILILSLSGIGNHLMQTPIFRSMKEAWPESQLTVWVAPRNTSTLAKANSDIDYVIRAPIKRSSFGHLRQIFKLRSNHFNSGLVLHPGQLWKSAIYLCLAGINQRIGHRYPHLGNPDSAMFLTESLPINPDLHDTEQNLQLLKPFSINPPPDLAPYYLTIPKSNSAQADHLLKNISSPKDSPLLVGLHPGSAADYSWKRWPAENFSYIGKKIAKQHNAHILIFGNSSELKLMKGIRANISKHNSSIINNKLLTSAALIKNCSLFISNDSGLMHVASALDVPTIGLFGPTDEKRTGPRGKHSLALRAPNSSPVYDVNSNFDLGPSCHDSLKQLKTNQVLQAAQTILP